MDRVPIIKNPELFKRDWRTGCRGLIIPLDVRNGWLSPYKENDITRPIFTSAAMNIC